MNKNIWIFIFLICIYTLPSWAQDRTVGGIVFDLESHYRLSRVYVYNTRSEVGVMNNRLGEFNIDVQAGDILIAASEGFKADTIKVRAQNALIFKLKSLAIRLKPVTVNGIRKTPKQQYEEKLDDYRATLRNTNGDILGGDGAGVNIDVLFGLISKQGRNARILQRVLERDYHDAVIDFKFTKSLVQSTTKEPDSTALHEFMFQYRPSYYFVLYASEYDLVNYIKMCYQSFKRNPLEKMPPDLPKVSLPKP